MAICIYPKKYNERKPPIFSKIQQPFPNLSRAHLQCITLCPFPIYLLSVASSFLVFASFWFSHSFFYSFQYIEHVFIKITEIYISLWFSESSQPFVHHSLCKKSLYYKYDRWNSRQIRTLYFQFHQILNSPLPAPPPNYLQQPPKFKQFLLYLLKFWQYFSLTIIIIDLAIYKRHEIVSFPSKILGAGRTQLLIPKYLWNEISSCAWPAPCILAGNLQFHNKSSFRIGFLILHGL